MEKDYKDRVCSSQNEECRSCGADDSDEDPAALTKIITAAVLFAAALTAEHIPALQSGSAFLSGQQTLAAAVPVAVMALYIASYLVCGLDVVKDAVKNILKGRVFDEKFLMAVASLGAVAVGQYPEAVAVMLFYQIGEYFQDYAAGRSRASISALMDLRPDTAYVKRNGQTVQVKPEDVVPGETIVVKPGERVPLDGVVSSGKSFVDTSALTGESVPREVFEGNNVMAGFVNTTSVLEIQVLKVYGESALSRIMDLVEHASDKKAHSERFITRFAKIYTPAVCTAALLLAVIPPLVTGGNWSTWIYRALIFLVVSCPCALVISIPLSFFGGIGAASRAGILVKGSNYLESLARTKTAVFDKTGTLTKGVFVVTAVHPAMPDKIPADELIAIAAHSETFSNHPISKSLKAAHNGACCRLAQVTDAEEISGQGLRVNLDGRQILIGNKRLMDGQQVTGFVPCTENDAGTIVHVAVNGEYAGHIVISDESKEDAAQAVAQLKKLGVQKTVMLTGDNEDTARKTAEELGIDEAYSNLLPENKVEKVEQLLAELGDSGNEKRGKLLFVGDGINDAPVLSRADVGIAMGAMGSDAAIEAADVVIMTDEPSKVAESISIARRTVRIADENIVFSLAVKIAVMVLGALGIADMWFAVFGDVGVTFIAVMNAMRMLVGRKK